MGTIHFIWLGNNLIPEDSIKRIQDIKTSNPKANLFLWIDSNIVGASQQEKFFELFPYSNFKLSDLNSLTEKITFKDKKSEAKQLLQLVLYESRRLKPNYGAASDILRYLILYLEDYSDENKWHAYFDHDVLIGNCSINSFLTKTDTQTLFFTSSSQGTHFSANDAFICNQKGNPILKAVLEKILKNYSNKSFGETNNQSRELTSLKTGSTCLLHVLKDLYKQNKLVGWTEDNFIIGPDDHFKAFTPPAHQAIPKEVCRTTLVSNSWMNTRAQKKSNLKEILLNALHDIQFESSVFGVLKLDNQVNTIIENLIENLDYEAANISIYDTNAGNILEMPIHQLAIHFNILEKCDPEKMTELERLIVELLIHNLEANSFDFSKVKKSLVNSRHPMIQEFYLKKLQTETSEL